MYFKFKLNVYKLERNNQLFIVEIDRVQTADVPLTRSTSARLLVFSVKTPAGKS